MRLEPEVTEAKLICAIDVSWKAKSILQSMAGLHLGTRNEGSDEVRWRKF